MVFSCLRSSRFDVSVQSVVTDVEFPIFHPLDADGTIVQIKVVLQKVFLAWKFLPRKLVGDWLPEGIGVIQGFLKIKVMNKSRGFKFGHPLNNMWSVV